MVCLFEGAWGLKTLTSKYSNHFIPIGLILQNDVISEGGGYPEDKCSWSACLEGMVIPSPPILAGRANKAHSRSLGGGLPVSAGISLVCRASSSGFRRWLMFGTVRHR